MQMTNAELHGQIVRMGNELKAQRSLIVKVEKELASSKKDYQESLKKMGNEVSALKRQIEDQRRKASHAQQSFTELTSNVQRLFKQSR